MVSANNSSLRAKVCGSLRLRLTVAVVLIVLLVTVAGMVLDYRREYRVHMEELRASLTEQARALLVARKHISQPSQFNRYVDEFCAQMNERISPGHHVLVLDSQGEILASTRHHTGPLLGVMPDGEWSSRNIQLAGNERIYLYTDGAIEAGAPLNMLGKEGLERLVRQCGDLPLADQVAAIMNEVFQHYSDEPADDVTILAMEFSTAASGLATNH